VREQPDYCSLVMSVTVPRLTKLPSESETETTALTTADLSLLLVSTLELATPWLAWRVMLLVRGLSRERDKSGAWISTNLVGPMMFCPTFCFPMMKSALELL